MKERTVHKNQMHYIQPIQAIIDALPGNISVIDEQGTIVAVNASWNDFAEQNGAPHITCNSIGCNYLDICQQAILANVPQAEQALQGVQAVLSGQQKRFIMEYPCHAPGRKAWFRMSVTYHANDLQLAVICHTDITELKLAEQETRLLSAVITNNDSIIVFKDLNLRVLATNMAFARASGHTTIEELIGKTDAEIFGVTPETEPVHSYMDDDRQAQKLPQGDYILREEPVILPDGSSIFVLTKKYPIYDQDGQLIGTGNISTDITSLKQHEKSLRKLSQAVQQSPVSIIITDHEGTIEFANPSFTRMTGYQSQDVVGQNLRRLKSGKMLPALSRHLWQTISSGQAWEGELYNRRKDGSKYWEHASISPIRDANGLITHYLAIKEDITEQKLLQERLLQSQKMETVGQLAGGMAHDFNNILGIIDGYASLLQLQLGQQPDLRKMARHIEEATEKAARLTHGLLAYSRQQIIDLQPHNLSRLVASAKEFIKRIVGTTIKVRLVAASTDLLVTVDRMQIEQVLYNFASNARDAMPDGGCLTIATSPVPAGDSFLSTFGYGRREDFVLMTITDTGSGMDSDIIKKIFDPFFTTKSVGKGTGLGLSMIYGIIRQHNGRIQVTSKPEKGTIFKVYLPTCASAKERQP
jgi:PAS domain S-box-containing protein